MATKSRRNGRSGVHAGRRPAGGATAGPSPRAAALIDVTGSLGHDGGMEPIDEVVLASRALLGVVARSVAPALERVSLPQFRLLVILSSSGPLKQGLLSERAGLSAPSTSRMVDRLIAQGLALREASAVSRREVSVAITPDGRDLVRQATGTRRKAIAEILDRVPPSEREALVAGFRAFAEAAGEAALEDLLLLGV